MATNLLDQAEFAENAIPRRPDVLLVNPSIAHPRPDERVPLQPAGWGQVVTFYS